MATHKEKDEEIKSLKNKVRQLTSEAKSVESDINGLDSEAHGIIINKEGDFTLVSIKFDADSKKAAVERVDKVGKSLAMAASKVKHAVIDSLVLINKRNR